MKVLIVFNHPYEGSYCNAILKSVLTGLEIGNHDADVIHLDKDEFDPVMRPKDLKAFVMANKNQYKPTSCLMRKFWSINKGYWKPII